MTTRGKCTKLSDQFSDPKDRDICNKCFHARTCSKLNFNIVHSCAITVNQIVQSIIISLYLRISLLVIRTYFTFEPKEISRLLINNLLLTYMKYLTSKAARVTEV